MSQGTGTPKVTVSVASGNLKRLVRVLDGVAGIVGTSVTKIGETVKVFGYDDAVAKGYTATAEPFLNKQIQLFYDELGGNQELWIMGVEDTMTLTQMVTSTNANGLKKLLLAAQGAITMVYICRKPGVGYTMVAGHYLDKDVEDAVLASKTLCQYQQSINRPVRILIEGRINDDTQEPFEPNTANNTYVGVVLGGDSSNTSNAGALALARACKYGSHVKIGNGLNGALSITSAFIGDKAIEEFYPEELDALSNAGYIIPHQREGAAGYYFGVDNMAGADDFRILVHGRLIDKAHRITIATATPYIETEVRLESNGSINATDAKYLEDLVKAQIRSQMSGQISDVDVYVPTDVDIVNTSTGEIEVKILPLGYFTWLVVKIGLTANL